MLGMMYSTSSLEQQMEQTQLPACKDADDYVAFASYAFLKPVFINCIRFMRCLTNKEKALANKLFNTYQRTKTTGHIIYFS